MKKFRRNGTKMHFGDARDVHLGPRPSMPPRTRPGATYPGGKHMRKALAKLAMRRQRYGTNISRGHERGDSYYAPGSPARQLPGSMNGKG